MASLSPNINWNRISLTLNSIKDVLTQLLEWNQHVLSAADYYSSQQGMQLLAANCTLITAIGEGINRITRLQPDFLRESFPDVPWKDIIGMRNHIAHGYFELDAEIVYESIVNDFPSLLTIIIKASEIANKMTRSEL